MDIIDLNAIECEYPRVVELKDRRTSKVDAAAEEAVESDDLNTLASLETTLNEYGLVVKGCCLMSVCVAHLIQDHPTF